MTDGIKKTKSVGGRRQREEARSGTSAAELLAAAAQDEDLQRRHAERQAEVDFELERAVADAKQEQLDLVRRIRDHGYEIELLEDLREAHDAAGYGDIVDLLIDGLRSAPSDSLATSIASALNHRCARGRAGSALIDAFGKWSATFEEEMCLPRDVLSGAIDTTATEAEALPLRDLVEDPENRPHIALLLPSYGRILKGDAVEFLTELLDNSANVAMAIRTLGNLRAVGAEQAIEAFVDDDDPYLRNEAKKALSKLKTARRTGNYRPRVPHLRR